MTGPAQPGRGDEPSVRVLWAYAGMAALLIVVGAVAGETVRAIAWPVGGLLAGIAFVTLLWSRIRPKGWRIDR